MNTTTTTTTTTHPLVVREGADQVVGGKIYVVVTISVLLSVVQIRNLGVEP